MVHTMKTTHGKVTLNVDEQGVLTKIFSADGCEELKIPHVLPTGETIKEIGPRVVSGEFGRIIIDDEIDSVCSSAFAYSEVGEIVWPSACKEIPDYCFQHSLFTAVHNTEHVAHIGVSAFSGSNIESFVWPKNCHSVPFRCFAFSSISSIDNLTDVVSIKEGAFMATQIKHISWPRGCKSIPRGCFLYSKIKSIDGIEQVTCIGDSAFEDSSLVEITWPDECRTIPTCCFAGSCLNRITNLSNVTEIGRSAFYEASELESLDLSSSPIVQFGISSFYQIDVSKIKLPYYVDSDDIQYAFA